MRGGIGEIRGLEKLNHGGPRGTPRNNKHSGCPEIRDNPLRSPETVVTSGATCRGLPKLNKPELGENCILKVDGAGLQRVKRR
jgi:hypothetical protein